MVPAGLCQTYGFGVKMLKYTTALVTESGWAPINRPENEARLYFSTMLGASSKMAPSDENAGGSTFHDTSTQAHWPAQPIDEIDSGVAMEEFVGSGETSLLDAKYFDLDNYLEHSQHTNGQRSASKAESIPVGKRKILSIRSRTTRKTEGRIVSGAFLARKMQAHAPPSVCANRLLSCQATQKKTTKQRSIAISLLRQRHLAATTELHHPNQRTSTRPSAALPCKHRLTTTAVPIPTGAGNPSKTPTFLSFKRKSSASSRLATRSVPRVLYFLWKHSISSSSAKSSRMIFRRVSRVGRHPSRASCRPTRGS